MDEFRKELIKELIKELENVFGELKNNEIALHGICIHSEDERVSPVMCLEEYILPYAAGIMTLEEIATELLGKYREDKMPRNIADHLDEFHAMKGRVRIKVINYAANTQRLKQIPHRRFLDLAIAYYLDMEMCMEAGKLTIEIGNHLMEKWDVTEEDLYRLGMVNMSAKDSFYSDEMVGIIRKTAQTGLDEDAEKLLELSLIHI